MYKLKGDVFSLGEGMMNKTETCQSSLKESLQNKSSENVGEEV